MSEEPMVMGSKTVFHEVAEKWSTVTMKDGSLRIPCFVDAVIDFLVVFKALGSAFFTDMVKSDMKQNLEKIQASARKYSVETVREMVEAEVRDQVYMNSTSGTEALLWLKRTLQFILLLLHNIATQESKTPLNECALQAYRDTLKPCHNWVLQRMFDAGLLCVPTRQSFFEELGANEDVVRVGMQAFMEVAVNHLNPLVAFFNQERLEEVCSAPLKIPSRRDATGTAVAC
uniref:Glycolipid transfer protein domain-containing protein n=1 Tax=Rhodosorus marinus TaxID=101924 RepID=A0A7S0G3D7_9RHOD|mmetsp:Transcript_19608/g.28534  ORF Transcript_19608/g.28534 Transcript_19608/m.28534 type:complete len:230 (+) Transcript_19608:354-1043(+)